VSVETALARIAALEARIAALSGGAPAPEPAGGQSADFATVLAASSGSPVVAAGAGGGGVGARMVALARGELGVSEAPPGSNDGPRIAVYRSAVPGGPVGPWCAYFVSWVARQAGAPLGERGQGFASVDQLWAWAQRAGRAAAADAQPRPGDLVVWDEHVGIVEAVLPDGRIKTIEGNTSDRVAERVHDRAGIVGFVRM